MAAFRPQFILFSFLLLITTILATPVTSISKRATSIRSGSTSVQWSTATTNHIRNYHVRDDGAIIESSWDSPGTGQWASKQFGPGAVAYTESPLSSYLIVNADGSYEVHVFYFNNDMTAQSLVYNKGGNGIVAADTEFNNKSLKVWVHAAIQWKDTSGDIQARFYYVPSTSGSQNTIYEYAWNAASGWHAGNGGNAIVSNNFSFSKGLAAVTWGNGGYISVFYWMANGPTGVGPLNDYGVRETQWSTSLGWRSVAAPSSDWNGFGDTGTLAATQFILGSDQTRLYVQYVRWSGTSTSLRMQEFWRDSAGWHAVNQMPSYTVDGSVAGSGVGVVAWPFGGQAHIRLHAVKSVGSSVRVHEINWDSASTGWKDGKNID